MSIDTPPNNVPSVPVTTGVPSVAELANPVVTQQQVATQPQTFFPTAPHNIEQCGLARNHVEELLLKALFSMGAATSRALADQIKLAGPVVREVLESLRTEMLVAYKGTADLVDYVFQLTENGVSRAEQLVKRNSYYGATPVPFDQYIASIHAQSLAHYPLKIENIGHALSELFLTKEKISTIAEAVNSGRGMFLFGTPGNGKTSVAERLMRSYPDSIWIPRTIMVGSDIIHIYDSAIHTECNTTFANPELVDRRWILVRRPTVIAGGELTMDHLEIRKRLGAGVLEAPLQMKANCGALVIDDFGRNKVDATDLLNRLIVPLDRKIDFVTMPNGRQVRVPFEELLVFSTNLRPHELVDEAFLRRIPFKIKMPAPTEPQFRHVFEQLAEKMQIEAAPDVVDYMIDQHFKAAKRPFRFCQPRDILFLIGNHCSLVGAPRKVTQQNVDSAINTYFVGA